MFLFYFHILSENVLKAICVSYVHVHLCVSHLSARSSARLVSRLGRDTVLECQHYGTTFGSAVQLEQKQKFMQWSRVSKAGALLI